MGADWEKYREKIIGLGEHSSHKSYYPELQEKICDLEISRANLQTILDSTNDGILIHDKNGSILFLNKQAHKLFNINEADTYRYNVFDITSCKMNKNELYAVWDEVLQNKPQIVEWIVCQIDTSNELYVQVSVIQTYWDGELVLVAVVRDFSERKKYENELIVAKKKAEESDQLKSVFLANLSHEIRTPMNAILGLTELLKKDGLSLSKRDDFIDIIKKSSNQLLSIISDIVEVSKIETNQIVPHYSTVNLNSLIDDLYGLFTVMVSSSSAVELIVKKPLLNPEIEVVTDEVKLRQVLVNLISNSFKFTSKGYIEFGFEVNDMVEFFVRDTGIGIDKKDHQVIFDRFRRVESDLAIQKGGSGLGLTIAKAYVEMLGGTISLDSDVGSGSTFKFTIPFVDPNADKKKADSLGDSGEVSNVDSVEIIVAEDDDDNFLYLFELLSGNSFVINRATNGEEVISILRCNRNIHLVLMDIRMPVMDGYEALRRIRQMNYNLPVIAQTAYAFVEDEARIQAAGFDGYIAKPIEAEHLFELIAQQLAK